jgi:hypothetical protein
MDVTTYAKLMADLAAADAHGRRAILARHGLNEETWSALDDDWQGRLSVEMAKNDEGGSAVLSEHTRAYQAAQRGLEPPIALEQFAEVTRHLEVTGDLHGSLATVGITLAQYVSGSGHWSRRMVEEPETEERFTASLRGRVPPKAP